MNDQDVTLWWQRLGLPGLIDMHTHFMRAVCWTNGERLLGTL